MADIPRRLGERIGDGHMVTRSPMARGLARILGLSVSGMDDPFVDGDGAASIKVAAMVRILRDKDLLVVYVESRKDLGYYGGVEDKLRALERVDRHVIEPMMAVMEAHKPYQVLLTSNGVVSTETRRPEVGDVPFVLSGSVVTADDVEHWDEKQCVRGSLGVVSMDRVMDVLRSETRWA